MKPKLANLVCEILRSDKSNEVKSVNLIILAEEAYNYGDIKAFSSIMEECKKLNPKIADSVPNTFKHLKERVETSPLPDIDFDF